MILKILHHILSDVLDLLATDVKSPQNEFFVVLGFFCRFFFSSAIRFFFAKIMSIVWKSLRSVLMTSFWVTG